MVGLKVLAADVNLGYHDWKNWILQSVDGQPIRDFDQFCQLVVSGQAQNTVFKDEEGYQMVINRQQAMATEAAVLNRYRVPQANACGGSSSTGAVE